MIVRGTVIVAVSLSALSLGGGSAFAATWGHVATGTAHITSASAWPVTQAPGSFTLVATCVGNLDHGTATASWTAAPRATSYSVVATNPDQVIPVSGLSTVITISKNKTVTAKVQGVSSLGGGPFSQVLSAHCGTGSQALTPPTASPTPTPTPTPTYGWGSSPTPAPTPAKTSGWGSGAW